MWVITTRGFFSVVQHNENPDTLLVRGRVHEDLERLAEIVEGLEMWHDPAADYAWRARVSPGEWAYALGVMSGEIDYRNFKNAVTEVVVHREPAWSIAGRAFAVSRIA
jgi:hypothetical protein